MKKKRSLSFPPKLLAIRCYLLARNLHKNVHQYNPLRVRKSLNSTTANPVERELLSAKAFCVKRDTNNNNNKTPTKKNKLRRIIILCWRVIVVCLNANRTWRKQDGRSLSRPSCKVRSQDATNNNNAILLLLVLTGSLICFCNTENITFLIPFLHRNINGGTQLLQKKQAAASYK